MISPLLLAASAAAAPVEVHPITNTLADIFVDACIKGEARLDPATTKRLSWNELPRTLKKRFEAEKEGEFYHIKEPSPAYLVVARYDPPTRDGEVMLCQLINEGVDLAAAWSRIASSATGKAPQTYRSGAIHYRMTLPQHRARVFLARKSMSATIYTEAAAKQLKQCGPNYYVWRC